tara:strand:+ start:1836 stop:2309 length:474 start_codon:yes stop_codon:yes gene_type:complete
MKITNKDLLEAREAWGCGIISISKTYDTKGIAEATLEANKVLEELYAFNLGPVLFKPTLSGGQQTFRSSKEGALSYFIGNNDKYPLDSGFGIKSWRKFQAETSEIFIDDNIAMWMGWVTLTNKDGDLVKVDKSWGYKKLHDGSLKIVLHHSSLPYQV